MTDRDPNESERLGRDPNAGSEGVGSGSSGGGSFGRDREAGGESERDRMGREPIRGSDGNRGEHEPGRAGSGRGAVADENPKPGRGWGIAALVVSILALVGSLFLFLNLILAIPGLILGIVALRKGSRGFGIAAIILSLLAVVLGIALTILLGAAAVNSPEFQQLLQEAQQQSE